LISAWYDAKVTYLATKEVVQSVYEAKYQIGRLDAFDAETMDMTGGAVTTMKECGVEVLSAKYKTEFSEWVYEKPETVTGRETDVDTKWAQLRSSCAVKRDVLDDDLSREVRGGRLYNAPPVSSVRMMRTCVDAYVRVCVRVRVHVCVGAYLRACVWLCVRGGGCGVD
jgi:hypothetical protein